MANPNPDRSHLGRPWQPGQSGNPGGRAKGLAKATRELVGDDGMPLAQFWLDLVNNKRAGLSSRLKASELLAERGWGKAPAHAPVEGGDPLELTDVDLAIAGLVDELATRREAKTPRPVADGAVEAAGADGHGR